MKKEAGIPQGWVITFKCSSAPTSSPFLPHCAPGGGMKRLLCFLWKWLALSAPFISKWNNLSTVAFFFSSLYLHLLQYTTHAPVFSFLLHSFSFPLSLQLSSISLIISALWALSVRSVRYGAPTSDISYHTQLLLCKLAIRCVPEQAFTV